MNGISKIDSDKFYISAAYSNSHLQESEVKILVDFSKTYHHFFTKTLNVGASCDFIYNQTLCPY